MLQVQKTFHDKWLRKITIKLSDNETAILKFTPSQLLYNGEIMLALKI